MIVAPIDKATKETNARPSAVTVERDLRQRIVSGALASGSALPSLRDLSQEYGVAINTVSRALKSLVEDGCLRSEGLRGRYVAHRGQSPSRLDPNSRAQRAQAAPSLAAPASIAIVAFLKDDPHLDDKNWNWHGVRAIEQAFLGDGNVTLEFHNRYCPSDAQDEVPVERTLRDLDVQNPSAIAVIFEDNKSVDSLIRYATAREIPVALLTDAPCHGPHVSEISFDDASAAYDAAMHLLRRGYDSICMFAPFPSFWAEHRIEGVRRALQASGVPQEKLLVSRMRDYDLWQEVSMTQENCAFEVAGEFLDLLPLNAGVVAVNDHCAIGFAGAARARGLEVGRDFGLVGFDDIAEARAHGVTSMRPPINAMGTEAARVLSVALSGGAMPDRIVLRSQLVPRQSTLRKSLRSV